MFVLKEASLHPDLTRSILKDSGIQHLGTLAWPGSPLPDIPGVKLHHIYSPSAEQVPLAASFSRIFVSTVSAIRTLKALPPQSSIGISLEAGDGRDGALEEDLPGLLKEAREHRMRVDALAVNFACMTSQGPTREVLEHVASLARQTLPAAPALSVGGTDILELADKETLPSEVSEIRCGTGVTLGIYPLSGRPVPGCRQDTFQLETHVLECSVKNGRLLLLLDVGEYHTAPGSLVAPFPGMAFRASSSAYTSYDVTECPEHFKEGQILNFGLDYHSLARALSSRALPLDIEDA